ncbi:hypothetical protein EYF80_049550 [Liparis tanakae]|uniref:Uncharacterized protein n=1 Tax=Liparis tanakae TaxID=230148 RepID=A0A4Z2FHN8_9TELE|nr:hypothetical protein EYF80_049550 [Liparis tanakae]
MWELPSEEELRLCGRGLGKGPSQKNSKQHFEQRSLLVPQSRKRSFGTAVIMVAEINFQFKRGNDKRLHTLVPEVEIMMDREEDGLKSGPMHMDPNVGAFCRTTGLTGNDEDSAAAFARHTSVSLTAASRAIESRMHSRRGEGAPRRGGI